jgi:adenosyl cobinamide kinase/adenosyl cobinamide phosphate guanylyltransferase
MPYKELNEKTFRQILYITGASGSGKSYYSKMYIQEYKKLFPKNAVYIFSSLSEDRTLDSIEGLQRVKMNEKFYKTPFTIKDFANCLLVFDDTEVIKNPLLREKVTNILDLVLETGRHTSTFVIVTSHIATNGNRTKLILTEAHSVTIFPATIGGKTMKYLLDGYFGLDSAQVKRISRLKSRWITIIKSYPMIVLYEKGAYVLTKDDEDDD